MVLRRQCALILVKIFSGLNEERCYGVGQKMRIMPKNANTKKEKVYVCIKSTKENQLIVLDTIGPKKKNKRGLFIYLQSDRSL